MGVSLALLGFGVFPGASALAQDPPQIQKPGVQVVAPYHNDISLPLRDMPVIPPAESKEEREANLNPKTPKHHIDSPDLVIQRAFGLKFLTLQLTATLAPGEKDKLPRLRWEMTE